MATLSTNLYLGVQYYNGNQIVYDMGFEFNEKEDCVMSDYREILRGLKGQIKEDMEFALSTGELPIFSAERKINKHDYYSKYKVLRRYISKDIAKALGYNIEDIKTMFNDDITLLQY